MKRADPASIAAYRRKYAASEKGRAARKRYAQTPRGREAQRIAKQRSNRIHAAQIREASRRRKRFQLDRLAAIKVERGCADCGYNAHPAALDFDHLPGSFKVANVSALIGRTWATVEVEMAKCEVVCANCHRIRTGDRASVHIVIGRRPLPPQPEQLDLFA